LEAGLGALTEPAEFGFAQSALETQQQVIVGLTNIIDAFLVDDDGIHRAAQVEQMVRITIVARQARDLDAQRRADPAKPNLGDQALKALPVALLAPDLPRSSSMTDTSFQPSPRAPSAS
jgi:hypothetical protein